MRTIRLVGAVTLLAASGLAMHQEGKAAPGTPQRRNVTVMGDASCRGTREVRR